MTTTTSRLDTERESEPQESAARERSIDDIQIAEMIKTQYSGLLNLVRRKLKNRELAFDLINDAIVITLEHAKLGRLKQLESIGGYIFKVSMNLLRNHERSSNNRSDLRVNSAVMDVLAEYDSDGVEAAQIRHRTQRLIELLSSARDREIIKRFYLDEEDKQLICDELGLTPLQFTQVMSRARKRMKQIFDSQGFKRGDFFSLLL